LKPRPEILKDRQLSVIAHVRLQMLLVTLGYPAGLRPTPRRKLKLPAIQ